MAQVSLTVNTVPAVRCPDCGDVKAAEDVEPVTIYECGDCGATFTKESQGSHRCDCGKFAAKVTANGCPDCEAVELEDVDAITCPGCEDLIALEDIRA